MFHPEIEKFLLDFFLAATHASVYNHDIFDMDYAGGRTEDQANKNLGATARYAILVHNDLNANSGRQLLAEKPRNSGREQHYIAEEAGAQMSRWFMFSD